MERQRRTLLLIGAPHAAHEYISQRIADERVARRAQDSRACVGGLHDPQIGVGRETRTAAWLKRFCHLMDHAGQMRQRCRERGIAWRVADSLSLRQFLGYGIDENTPDHVTISRTRRLLAANTHQKVFDWVLERLAQVGLVKGKTMGVDSTTLEANAAMKSIVRRDTGDNYMSFLKKVALSAP